ncbi:MAG: nitroreductase family protein, partial [Lachnospiraceae bacterium]|nr:nitroreductase family protein [Lachnospiraceae bacterium]
VIVVLADKNVATYVYDGSLVMGNMMNAAEDLGVASCWIHRAKEMFETPEGKQILKDAGIEGDYEGIGNLVIGYDDNGKREKAPRKDNYVHWA